MSRVDIRLTGLPDDLKCVADLLAGLEVFLETGDTTALQKHRLEILERGGLYKNRGESKFYRQYLTVDVE